MTTPGEYLQISGCYLYDHIMIGDAFLEIKMWTPNDLT